MNLFYIQCLDSFIAGKLWHGKAYWLAHGPLLITMNARKYLSLYNAISAALWAAVLVRLAIVLPLVGFDYTSQGVAPLLIRVQSLAALEIVHAVIGVVRSNPLTVAMQVASRLFLVWGVIYPFPGAAASPAFSVMVVAWCLAELIRYPFYWSQLYRITPHWLSYLRYTAFYILYPVGVGAEMYLTYRAIPLASYYHPTYAMVMKIVLIIYLPAFYKLYTHMIHLRAKVLK